jgi:hypothetical protein
MQKWAELVVKWPQQFRGLELCECLFNTFLYIEIGGTDGSAFRTMYSKFLEEASIILNNPDLNNVAQTFKESAQAWSRIALCMLFPILGQHSSALESWQLREMHIF